LWFIHSGEDGAGVQFAFSSEKLKLFGAFLSMRMTWLNRGRLVVRDNVVEDAVLALRLRLYPRVQPTIRETLLNRKDQLLKAAYYEVACDDAK
jgi:hypothetical protein